jgi:competence protein ComEC
MAFGIAPFAGAWAYGPEPIATWAGWLGGLSVGAWLEVLSALQMQPWTPAVDWVGGLFLCLIFVRAHPTWVLAVLCVGLGLHARPRAALEVWFFDVGQGDAALVSFPDGRRWLVDGGRSDRLVPALRRLGVRRLHKVIASHGDADHAGGLPAVVCGLDVEEVVVGREADHEDVLAAAARCEVPVVVQGVGVGSANATSLVFRAESAFGDVLFTGDVDVHAEPAFQVPAAVVKVPHHGSATSSSWEMLQALRPELGVVSVGRNPYGHPHPDALERYRRADIPLVRTDQAGSVRVRLDASGVRYGAIGPLTWFSFDLRAPMKNTTTAKAASARLIPWL